MCTSDLKTRGHHFCPAAAMSKLYAACLNCGSVEHTTDIRDAQIGAAPHIRGCSKAAVAPQYQPHVLSGHRLEWKPKISQWECSNCGYRCGDTFLRQALNGGILPKPCAGAPVYNGALTKPHSYAVGPTTHTTIPEPVVKHYPKCTACKRELCAELDAYFGQDARGKGRCAPCRRQTKID